MRSRLLPFALLLSLTAPALPAPLPPHTPSPDFTRPDLAGHPIHLAGFHGKLILLNFWATWCGPCLAEIPRFSAWQQKYGPRGLQVIGISMDDSLPPVQRIYRKYQLTYPVVMGDEHLGELYGGILGLPVTFLIDPQGRILRTFSGEPDLRLLESEIYSNLPPGPVTSAHR